MAKALVHCHSLLLEPGAALPEGLLASSVPVKLLGYVSHWQAVKAAQQSDDAACEHLLQSYTGEPVGVFFGAPEINGRFFYNKTLDAFNFEKVAADLGLVLRKILESQTMSTPPSIFLGGTHLSQYLPGFTQHNPPVPIPSESIRNGLWVGNQTRVAIHQDLPLNIACCVAGKRRFTLFPPAQTANLYIGPLEFTPSGQAVSLVDSDNYDAARFPRFKDALAQAQVAELAPGDALFIPSMWWHQVDALAPFNVLVNYWWRTTPAHMDAPINALYHALLSIAGLPEAEKQIWREMFEHYVFADGDAHLQHIPERARGILNPQDEDSARRIRSLLLQALNR